MPSKKSPSNQALAKAIRLLRTKRGFTQESLASRAGIDRSYCGAIERGEFNLTVDSLMKIADGLDVTASELLQRAKL